MAGMKFYLKVFFACFVISILLSEVVINLFYTDLAQSTIIFLDFLMAIILTGLTYIAVDINERRKNPLGFIFPMESLNGCGTTSYVSVFWICISHFLHGFNSYSFVSFIFNFTNIWIQFYTFCFWMIVNHINNQCYKFGSPYIVSPVPSLKYPSTRIVFSGQWTFCTFWVHRYIFHAVTTSQYDIYYYLLVFF